MNKYRQQEVTGRRIHLDSQVYCLIVCLASQTAPASKSNGPIRERIKDSVLKTQVHLCCLQQQYKLVHYTPFIPDSGVYKKYNHGSNL